MVQPGNAVMDRTVNQLKKAPNFAYIGGHLVTRFLERCRFVEVECLTIARHSIASLCMLLSHLFLPVYASTACN